ncbi:PepSY domain-containing protein, partial [Pseudomonas aeruginosa]
APGWISVHHPYDEAATVDIRRRDASRILDDQRTVNFDASSGELLHAQPSYAPGYATYGWLTGLHMIQWGGQLVRWMYLLLGLSGAMMIFGGLQVWLAKREVRGSRGVGLVRALNLAVCGGLPLASLALLWGNRLLPTQLAGRDTWEIRVFCASWALVALWAIVRRNSGTLGRTQLRLAAVLALGLPLLGLLRSPEGNLLASLQRGDWVLAGVDLSLLGLGLLCAWLGWRRRQASSKPVRRRLNVQEVA